MKRRIDPHQLLIDWNEERATTPVTHADPSHPPANATSLDSAAELPPLILSLPWDFQTSFPTPTDEAIEAGVIQPEDAEPENIRSIHEEHARESLAILHDLDAVMDARRRGVDPTTGKPPRTHASKERLRRLFEAEPSRLERSFANLLAVYQDGFGPVATDAFEKSLRARHAGIPVVADARTNRPIQKRVSSVLPVPKPLASAVAAGHFGQEEDGKTVRPSPAEVRAITERHAEKVADLIAAGDDTGVESALTKYAESFGEKAARQLGAHANREVSDRNR